jgi:hypothetical protein
MQGFRAHTAVAGAEYTDCGIEVCKEVNRLGLATFEEPRLLPRNGPQSEMQILIGIERLRRRLI